jgi:hypothetical protein
MARTNPRVEQLEREVATLRKMLASSQADPGDMPCAGCGDNSCVVRHPTGMATNGGCRCEARELRRAVMWHKRRATFLEETIKELMITQRELTDQIEAAKTQCTP